MSRKQLLPYLNKCIISIKYKDINIVESFITEVHGLANHMVVTEELNEHIKGF